LWAKASHSWTRAEVAQRADNFLAGTFGCENAFDEEIVEIGFAFIGVRSFADIHRLLDTIRTWKRRAIKYKVDTIPLNLSEFD
jgi:hypothetical protein